jgi:hypothetical protein
MKPIETRSLTKLQKLFQGGYPKEPEYQNFEYKGHQVGPNDSGNQNISNLALKEKTVEVTQILSSTGTDTRRDD